MSNNPNNIIFVIIVIAVTYPLILGLYRRSDEIVAVIKHAAIVEGAYFLTFFIAKQQLPGQEITAIVYAVLAGFIADRLYYKKTTRYIPRSERRKAIEKFEKKTGEKYNPKKHEFDHIVPFSKWGDNKNHNLRIIPKKENRRKGNRNHWWWGD